MKQVLDACCGSRMFYLVKNSDDVLYMDNRQYFEKLSSGHIVDVNPDVREDFRIMPFADESFSLVIFDPPHLIRAGDSSWLAKNTGS